MAWGQPSAKPLPEPEMTLFYNMGAFPGDTGL